MIAYYIHYKVRGNDKIHEIDIDAKDTKSAKRKIGKKHGYKDGRMIQFVKVSTIGYF